MSESKETTSEPEEIIYDSEPSKPDDDFWLEQGRRLLTESFVAVSAAANALMTALGVLQGIYLGILGFAKFIPEEWSVTRKAAFILPRPVECAIVVHDPGGELVGNDVEVGWRISGALNVSGRGRGARHHVRLAAGCPHDISVSITGWSPSRIRGWVPPQTRPASCIRSRPFSFSTGQLRPSWPLRMKITLRSSPKRATSTPMTRGS